MKTDDKSIPSGALDRRKFLLETLKKSGQIAMATGVIYSVTLVVDKKGMTAGAK